MDPTNKDCLMSELPMIPAPPRPQEPAEELMCLMGATRLADFINFVRERTVGGRGLDRAELADRWRDASDVYDELETSEAGAADKPRALPLSALLQAHVDELVQLPGFQSTFSSVPVAFGMVELDKLVVYQHHLMLSSVDKMVTQMPRPVSDEVMAGLCLPLTAADASFKLAHEDGKKFVFVSDTHDTRFLGARLVQASDIKGFAVNGHAQAVIALGVGFTTNVLNVVRYGGRMVLNNGYHRAWALRQLGVSHAPCLIQVCRHWEDVGLAGNREIYENGEVYFSSARPPMLRDFGNPALTRIFPARRLRREIRISYEVDSIQLEA
jgi:hypothetical protein